MRKVFWKRTAASAMAAALVLTGVNTSGIGVEAKAETANLFTDGDLGDDGSSFWSEDRVWYFTDDTWNAASEIKYDQYAGNGTDSGLGIYYGNADGTVGMYQTVASIEAGTYELTGDVKETNGKGGTVKGFYGSEEKETAESAEITNDFGQFQFTFTVDEAEEKDKEEDEDEEWEDEVDAEVVEQKRQRLQQTPVFEERKGGSRKVRRAAAKKRASTS